MELQGTVTKVSAPDDETPGQVHVAVEEGDTHHAGELRLEHNAGKFDVGDRVAMIIHGGLAAAGAVVNAPLQILQSDEHKLMFALGQNHQAVLLKAPLEDVQVKQPGLKLSVFNERLSGPGQAAAPAPANPFAQPAAAV